MLKNKRHCQCHAKLMPGHVVPCRAKELQCSLCLPCFIYNNA